MMKAIRLTPIGLTAAAWLLLLDCSSSSTNEPDDKKCVPGTTIDCKGAGNCLGQQACRADGRGYEACSCGSGGTGGGAAGSSGSGGETDASPDSGMPQLGYSMWLD